MANDNTVRFNGATIQLLADDLRSSYARAKVEVQERLDGSTVVVHQGKTLAAEPAPHGPVILRARNGRRSNGHVTSTGASTHLCTETQPTSHNKDQDRTPQEASSQPPMEKTPTDIIIEHLH